MKIRRILALVLALCMLLGCLAGCSKPGEEKNPSGNQESGKKEEQKKDTNDGNGELSSKYAYKADYFDLDLDCDYVSQTCINGNYLYLLGEKYSYAGGGGIVYKMGVEEYSFEEEGAEEETEADAEGDTEAEAENVAVGVEEPVVVAPIIDGGNNGPSKMLARVDLTTGEVKKLEGYVDYQFEEGQEGYSDVNYLGCADDGSIWVVENISIWHYELPDDFDPETSEYWEYEINDGEYKRVMQYSADGELLSDQKMPVELEGSTGFYVQCIDKQGRIYVSGYDPETWQTKIFILNPDFSVLKTVDMGGKDGNLTTFLGQPAVEIYGEQNMETRLIDPETLELGEPQKLPATGWGNYYPCTNGEYDLYYYSENCMYGYHQADDSVEKVMDWLDCDVDSNNIRTATMLEDGRIMGLIEEYTDDGEQKFSIVLCSKVDASTLPQKTILTLACIYLDWDLRSAISEFNRKNDSVRITVEDYSQYIDNEGGYQAALEKLNTEIIAGKMPDLISCGSDIPVEQYAAKGYLEDLLPWIDQDAELSREDLMTRVIDAACTDGKLYRAFNTFQIVTAMALSKVVGDYDQWTLAEVRDAMTRLQPEASVLDATATRWDIMYNTIYNNISSFVDWGNAACHFDSQEFKDLLEFAKALPEDFDWEAYYEDYDWSTEPTTAERLMKGLQLMVPQSYYDLDSYAWMLAEYNQCDLQFVGYPSIEGNNNTFSIGSSLCMTSACRDKEGAWSFIRGYFTEDSKFNEHLYGLPVNANLFQKRVDELSTVEYYLDENGEPALDENGEKMVAPKATYWDPKTGEITYQIDALSEEQIAAFMDLYNSASVLSNYDQRIIDIIDEEVAPYFAGEKSVDEVANNIQNRAGLYVMEKG